MRTVSRDEVERRVTIARPPPSAAPSSCASPTFDAQRSSDPRASTESGDADIDPACLNAICLVEYDHDVESAAWLLVPTSIAGSWTGSQYRPDNQSGLSTPTSCARRFTST